MNETVCTSVDDVECLLDECVQEFRDGMVSRDRALARRSQPADLSPFERLSACDDKTQILILRIAFDRVTSAHSAQSARAWETHRALKALLIRLLRRKLTLSEDDILYLLNCASRTRGISWELPWGSLLGRIETFLGGKPPSPALAQVLLAIRERLAYYAYAENRKCVSRIDRDLAAERPLVTLKLCPGDAWADTLIGSLQADPTRDDRSWQKLLLHCQSATTSKPSRKWLKACQAALDCVGQETFARVMSTVLEQIGKRGSRTPRVHHGYTEDTSIPDAQQTDLLRGLIWTCSLCADEMLIASLGSAAEASYKKIPNIGPRAPKVGNACVVTLARLSDKGAVAQLGRLLARVKHASVRSQVEKALDASAETLGMTREDLEESTVPTLGLHEIGRLQRPLSGFVAEIAITESRSTQTRFIKPDGKSQKSVPQPVKNDFSDDLKAFKQTEKQLKQLLPSIRDRLERLIASERSWTYPVWKERFHDHPLTGWYSRRLIWHFASTQIKTQAVWWDGQFVDADNEPVDWIDESTSVSLWHPLGFPVDQVRRWREWLVERELTQPFKQAHREIYVLTDAELETRTYSNRFAAHILRQHQFAALCRERGWRYGLQGAWDSHNVPYLDLPRWNLRAEYWVESIGQDMGQETSHAGIFLHLSTDQVRFYRLVEAREGTANDTFGLNRGPLPLTDVPALAFSEVMRDVDLFVGVSSVANDPHWADGGPQGAYRDYWHSYSFGELSATARTRKGVLERLVPRLKIAHRCSFSDRYLLVRGDIRTYKIHLGSGNVLMLPNEQYLCIVPDPRASRSVGSMYLPFEGDSTMSLILSKALLLAEDLKISDPSIARQIEAS